jgi:hypothetical protein
MPDTRFAAGVFLRAVAKIGSLIAGVAMPSEVEASLDFLCGAQTDSRLQFNE